MAWLGTWAKRKEISIDNTNIDSDLTHFPIPIVLGASVGQSDQDVSDIFDDLGSDANRFKIAITKSDGTTQIYGDIEHWSDANEKAVIWVAKSDLVVSSTGPTTLYFYYDPAQADNTTYIGDSGGTAAQSVWSSSFLAVHHMSQDPNGDAANCIKDSTSNNNDGTPVGSMTSADLVDGVIGKALDLDGTNDYILTTGVNKTALGTAFTLLVKLSSAGSSGGLLQMASAATSGNPLILLSRNGSTTATYYLNGGYQSNFTLSANTPTLLGLTFDGTVWTWYTNGVSVSSATTALGGNAATGLYIGNGYNSCSGGIFESVMVATSVLSAAWIKATHHALIDNLITYPVASGPGLEIDAATDIGAYSATLNGEITDMAGEASLDVSFEYGETTAYGSDTTEDTLTAAGTVSSGISGLDPGTLYHFRLKATNGVDTRYSSDASFTTLAPALETDPAIDITGYTATLNGELTGMGGIASLDVYFEYGPTTSYGTETTPETLTTTGVFDVEITEIKSHTTYHFRAAVTDGTDTWYGADATFFSLYSFAPPAPINLQGVPGPFSILWSWEEPYFLWSQITIQVDSEGVPYTYPKGMGLRYAPVISVTPTVIAETPINENTDVLTTPVVPSISISSTVYQPTSGVTMSIANPCVVTLTDHGLADEAIVKFTTTGALPTGITAGMNYYIDYIDANTFYLEQNIGGSKVVSSGTQSGVHTLWKKL